MHFHMPTLKLPNLEEELLLYVAATDEVISIVLMVERVMGREQLSPSVLRQWDLEGRTNKIPNGSEAVVCDCHDIAEAESLFLTPSHQGGYWSASTDGSVQQRCHREDLPVGYRAWLVPGGLRTSKGNQGTSIGGLHRRLDRHWTMYFDVSYTLKGSGAGVVLVICSGLIKVVH